MLDGAINSVNASNSSLRGNIEINGVDGISAFSAGTIAGQDVNLNATNGAIGSAGAAIVLTGPSSLTLFAGGGSAFVASQRLTLITLSSVDVGTNELHLTGGAFASSGSEVINDNASLFLDAGVFDLVTFTETVNQFTLLSGELSGSGSLISATGFNVESGTVAAVLAGSAGLDKSTSGTVELTGANTYSGATTVSAGTLQVSGSVGAGGAFEVNGTGATLTGTGTIHRNVAVLVGTLAPGASPGVLSTRNLDLTTRLHV